MHYQLSPAAEVKLVRCIRGSFYDVALDLATGKWFGTTLSADNRRMLYVPEGCAHGFLTLEDDTEALYLTTSYWSPEHERGVRWDDPAFGIEWPLEPVVLSEKDRAWPLSGS
jgi:dTDP-4-dehydrorhamnose 3,5-epimerase